LTFDDGPLADTTGSLLDILAEHGIKAMFFMVGMRLSTPEGTSMARRVHGEGHRIGNHTYSHPDLRSLEEDRIRDELQRTHDLICEVAGGCEFFRPPFGWTTVSVSKVLQEFGYSQLLWDINTFDWKLRRNGAWVEFGMKQVNERENGIVLMHDIHRSTVDHVDEFIRRVKRIPGSRLTLPGADSGPVVGGYDFPQTRDLGNP
jgi:peptidoglycan/xylan/chitin deacetylase (PgdA/CDA1 family)